MALVEITSNASLAYPDRRIECLRIGSVEPSVHIDTRSGAVGRKCAHMPFAVVDNRIGIPKRVERIHIELAGTSVDIEKYTCVVGEIAVFNHTAIHIGRSRFEPHGDGPGRSSAWEHRIVNGQVVAAIEIECLTDFAGDGGRGG